MDTVAQFENSPILLLYRKTDRANPSGLQLTKPFARTLQSREVNSGAATAERITTMYRLRCLGCGAEYLDDGLMVRCEHEHRPALLRTRYERTDFAPDAHRWGVMRYHRWLPARTALSDTCARTAVFQSRALSDMLRMPNLWLAFNGYWPARDALLPTGTFKDLETASVLARFPASTHTLVAASAGNTAAALASAASRYGVRTIIVVPENALTKMRFREPLAKCVRVIALSGDTSYDDAIAFARTLARADNHTVFEGGAANVARRDGIATTMLSVVETLGTLPEYFVQAIGSGCGAIAAHEAALRLLADGRFGRNLPKLLLVQNTPSAAVYESWVRRSRELVSYHDDDAQLRARLRKLAAPVLSTQIPPYEITGGLYDVLTESSGDVCIADSTQANRAGALFESLEGVSLEPAASVALAGLISRLENSSIDRDALVVLHVTGGGRVPKAHYRPESVEFTAVSASREGTAA